MDSVIEYNADEDSTITAFQVIGNTWILGGDLITMNTGGIAGLKYRGTAPYNMLQWMLMQPSLASSYHFAGTKLDGSASNHLFTQKNTNYFYWIKGDGSESHGWPWDINFWDSTYIYLSTTENGWTTPRRASDLRAGAYPGYKGVPLQSCT